MIFTLKAFGLDLLSYILGLLSKVFCLMYEGHPIKNETFAIAQ